MSNGASYLINKSREVPQKIFYLIALAILVLVMALAPLFHVGAATPLYSTYLGGSADEIGYQTFVDGQGNFYVSGQTFSTNFPTTTNGAQRTFGGGTSDAFAAKYNSSGNLIYSTYLGGSGTDEARDLVVDASGNMYVAGITQSSNFPVLSAFDSSLSGTKDGFVTKINSSGSIVFSTYLGGSADDSALAAAIDSTGSVYFSGETNSTDFLTTTGAYDRTANGDVDTYVTKLNSNGTVAYSTYLGGPGFDDGLAMTVDGSGNAFVTGKASPGYPVTAGAYDTTQNGGYDMMITKLNPTGSGLVYSTYLGGNNWDEGLGIGLDNSGNAYVTGNVQSPNYPVTSGAFQTTFKGTVDASVTKLNASGSALVYSTFFSGTDWTEGDGLAVNPSNGNVVITGHAGSTDIPVTANAIQPTAPAGVNAFVAKLDNSGSKLRYGTYIGGNNWDGNLGTISMDSSETAYVSGMTNSTDFPISAGAAQPTLGGGMDAIMVKVTTPNQLYPPANTSPPVISGNTTVGSTLTTSNGSWTNSPTSFTYQWQTSTTANGPWTNIAGATGSSYTVTSVDQNNFLRSQVTASNSDGSATASSASVGPVGQQTNTMTFNIAVGGDDGDVSSNNMGGSGTYPPSTNIQPYDTGNTLGARRAGPIFGGYELRNGLVRFNTSSLPAGATITSASLKLYVTSASSDNNRNLVAEWFNSAVWPINTSDYTVTSSNTASTGLAINSLAVNGVNTLTLQNLSSISRTGYTTIRLHVDGGQPSGENMVFMSTFEDSNHPRPQLIINYTL